TSRRRHTRFSRDWSSDVCSSDLHSPPVLRVLLLVALDLAKKLTGQEALLILQVCRVMEEIIRVSLFAGPPFVHPGIGVPGRVVAVIDPDLLPVPNISPNEGILDDVNIFDSAKLGQLLKP